MTLLKIVLSVITLYGISLGDQDCASDKFDCKGNNPCHPLCDVDQLLYPGDWNNNYLVCGKHGECVEHRCPPLTFWNQENEQCEDENGVVARCSYGKSNCGDKNPCAPSLCIKDLLFYPGEWHNKYIECDGSRGCKEMQCDSRYVWDQDQLSCVPKDEDEGGHSGGDSHDSESSEKKQDCDSDKFSCEYNDPCDPLCVEGQSLYPGNWNNNFIQCSDDGGCSEGRCPPKTYWNQETLLCENDEGIEARCSYGKHNCDDKNPCAPTLCTDELWFYPGDWHNNYVECGKGGACEEKQCEPLYVWDQKELKCVPKEEGPPVDSASNSINRCEAATFDCEDDTNPCVPSLCKPDILYYSHHERCKFVQCHPSVSCAVRNCAEGAEWSDEYQACIFV